MSFTTTERETKPTTSLEMSAGEKPLTIGAVAEHFGFTSTADGQLILTNRNRFNAGENVSEEHVSALAEFLCEGDEQSTAAHLTSLLPHDVKDSVIFKLAQMTPADIDIDLIRSIDAIDPGLYEMVRAGKDIAWIKRSLANDSLTFEELEALPDIVRAYRAQYSNYLKRTGTPDTRLDPFSIELENISEEDRVMNLLVQIVDLEDSRLDASERTTLAEDILDSANVLPKEFSAARLVVLESLLAHSTEWVKGSQIIGTNLYLSSISDAFMGALEDYPYLLRPQSLYRLAVTISSAVINQSEKLTEVRKMYLDLSYKPFMYFLESALAVTGGSNTRDVCKKLIDDPQLDLTTTMARIIPLLARYEGSK